MSFGSKNGYKTFVTRGGQTKFVHVHVMEKTLGGPLRRGQVVHHINGDKGDNRPSNLTALSRGVHGRVHGAGTFVCFNCGHAGHRAAKCFAKWDYAGRPLRQRQRRTALLTAGG
ncbi:HNH endonuclease [Corallococcus exiguus]|uniref:HNH endonuclease signature motif containing protein n=1 Tax=Corallococcus exiguus TaxID=83462 RepID=UPI001A8E0D99|nr:HNH endonuclease signature motif containing protein [Corallococcus exiguus]MBN8466179.1 HNH endonuclease [Corallococcus exiguus]